MLMSSAMPNFHFAEYVHLTNPTSNNVLVFPTVLLDFPTIHRLFTKNPYMVKKEGKILIIDDNKELLVALNLMFSPFFNTIKTESNPNLIPSHMRSELYDIILLDIDLRMDGRISRATAAAGKLGRLIRMFRFILLSIGILRKTNVSAAFGNLLTERYKVLRCRFHRHGPGPHSHSRHG